MAGLGSQGPGPVMKVPALAVSPALKMLLTSQKVHLEWPPSSDSGDDLLLLGTSLEKAPWDKAGVRVPRSGEELVGYSRWG